MPHRIETHSIEVPVEAEVVIKPRTKINAYDPFDHNPAQHLVRKGFTKDFKFDYPEDVALGIETSIDRKKISKFEELYHRYLELGWIDRFGGQCILMSAVTKRILAYHGIKSRLKQVTAYWQNEPKGQKHKIGATNGNGPAGPTPEGTIDTHLVVSSNGYILDFSMLALHHNYGMLAPRACIGLDVESDEYQDFGMAGEAAWLEIKPMHPIIRHWRFSQKPREFDLVREYFEYYQF